MFGLCVRWGAEPCREEGHPGLPYWACRGHVCWMTGEVSWMMAAGPPARSAPDLVPLPLREPSFPTGHPGQQLLGCLRMKAVVTLEYLAI